MESNATHRLQSVRDATKEAIGALADKEAGKAVAFVDTQDGLGNAAETARSACLDALLSEDFVAKVIAAAKLEKPSLGLLAYDLRRLAPPVQFNRPVVMETRIRGLALASAVGALAGMLAGVPFSVWLTGERTIGLVLGGISGAAALVLAVGCLGRKKRLRVAAQIALGAGAGATVGIWALWRKLLPVRGSRSVFSMVKAIGLFLFAIVALQLAAPKDRVAQQDCRDALRRRLNEWLLHTVDLLAFLAMGQQAADDSQQPASRDSGLTKEDETILRAVQKLSLAASESETLCVAKEINQQYRIAGFTFCAPESSPNVFDSSLKELYDEEDRIDAGDCFHVLVPPVMQDGQVVLKGRIARKRG